MSISSEISALKQQLGDAIETAMRTVVLDVVKESMVRAIDDVVYDAYEPTQYVRREAEGGLTDPENIDIESYDRSETQHTMVVKNYRNDFGGRDVAEIVNKGTGYTWKDSAIYQMQPYPRPFYQETDRILQDEGDLDMFLEIALSKF